MHDYDDIRFVYEPWSPSLCFPSDDYFRYTPPMTVEDALYGANKNLEYCTLSKDGALANHFQLSWAGS